METTDRKQDTLVDPSMSKVGKKESSPKVKVPRKKRKWVKRLIILLIILGLIAFFVFRFLSGAGQQISSAFFQPSTVGYQDLTVSVSSTGAIQPIDSYKVTALVKGEILEAPFEEGDTVQKDDLLYRIDSSDAENSIQRTQISVEQAKLSYQQLVKSKNDGQKNLNIKSNAAGVILKLYYKQGETVAAGTPFADILDRDNMTIALPFHTADADTFFVGQAASVMVDGTMSVLSGTVDKLGYTDQVGSGGTLVREVTIKLVNPGALDETSTGTASIGGASCAAGGTFHYAAQKTVTAKTSGDLDKLLVKEGDRVNEDQLLGSIEAVDVDSQIETSRLSLESAQLSLQSAQDQLDNYTISSPISGTIIEKTFKAGDNLDPSTAAANPSAAYMAIIYDMSILTFDMKIDELDINKIQVGQVVDITADALEGKTFTGRVDKININGVTANGVTTYPVTVIIDDPKELLPGMNVSAEILVEKVPRALCVPVQAVTRGNFVQVALPGALDATGKVIDSTKLEERQVTLGRNDSKFIEIVDGLVEGDVVVTKAEASDLYAMMMGG